jgi:hypothetical protein
VIAITTQNKYVHTSYANSTAACHVVPVIVQRSRTWNHAQIGAIVDRRARNSHGEKGERSPPERKMPPWAGGEFPGSSVYLFEAAIIRPCNAKNNSISDSRPYFPWFLSAIDPRLFL